MVRAHGGPGPSGAAEFDFSTNANACGPCPWVTPGDATRYPDPSYSALRECLAAFHGVEMGRIAIAGSASEFIFRMTAWVASRGPCSVSVPLHAYGDYSAAARAYGLDLSRGVGTSAHHPRPRLAWCCVPSSPLGASDTVPAADVAVLDLAYEPLRLSGSLDVDLDSVWQLWSPNKSLGLTGIRGAYAIAPAGARHGLDAFAPSWVLGAQGVAMLQSWCDPRVHAWLSATRDTLRQWKALQVEMLESLGFVVSAGTANFMVFRRPGQEPEAVVARGGRVQLRECSSFGLPRHYRASVQHPEAQQVLREALQ